ncbi:MAG TPA: urea transporter, partial [Cyclobacteriaceae bacterium]|nr:urea transporter [Cyclobacteriaceae bacterium]
MKDSLKWIDSARFIRDSVLNSYGQIFFSNARSFSILLFLASFANPFAGVCGLLSLLITISFAYGFGLKEDQIRSGAYGYNSLMVGFVIGVFYQVNFPLLVILFFTSILTLFITVWIASVMSLYKLPYLSIPFIVAVWILLLSTRSFEALRLSERGVYTMNEMSQGTGSYWTDIIQKINLTTLPFFLDLYFKSIGAIIFQYNLISGVLIAGGMLLYSRIAFSLSLIGFYFGYLFCYFVQGNLPELEYSYIGFNFILTAIALGGFYLIPSVRSYALVMLTMPLVSLMMSAFNRLAVGFQLPVYSLPFSVLVLLVIIVLRQRAGSRKLALTEFQEFSPERNLYAHHTRQERFKNDTHLQIGLPFFGTWHVSQGHAGELTHLEDWQYAWDFDVRDNHGKTFRLPGTSTAD